MKEDKPVVVGIGELLWDVLPTGKRAGGAPVNFVYHAARLGAEGYAVSAVGDDVSGTEIVQELDKNGICHSLGTVEYPTGSVMVELKDGIPAYTIIEGVAWDHIPLTQEAVALVEKADASVSARWRNVRPNHVRRSIRCFRMPAKRHSGSLISISASLIIPKS